MTQRIQFKIATLTFDCVRGTGRALPAQSLTIQAVLVSARPSMAICSFHELEQLAELLDRSSSCLELTVASPSLPVQGCRGYRYPWIYPWTYPWIYPCVDIRLRLHCGYIHGYSKSYKLNGHITCIISIHGKIFIEAGVLLTKQQRKSQ